jgi:hypothetical protein
MAHRLKNTSARNTEIPVFPYFRQPGRRALAPGFGAFENQPEASAKPARQTGHKTRFRQTQNTPINNTEIPVFPYFRSRRKRFKTSHSCQGTSSKKHVRQKYGNTGISVFPKPRIWQPFTTVPKIDPPDQNRKNDTPSIEQKHASIRLKQNRHEFYQPANENRAKAYFRSIGGHY